MEVVALRGAMQTLAKSTPQPIIEKINSNEQDIENFLIPLGCRIFPLEINRLAVHVSDPVYHQLAQNLPKTNS